MQRIERILNYSAISTDDQISLALVNRWIGDLRAIPYHFSVQWKTPLEVAREAVADCKGKAVALYQQLQASGARNLCLVIGKRTAISGVTHTWVEWTTPAATYVLDPTINGSARSLAEIPINSYIPYYAYSGSRRYRVANPGILLAGL